MKGKLYSPLRVKIMKRRQTQMYNNFTVNLLLMIFQNGEEFVRANCPEIVKGVEKLANLVKSLL